LNWIDSFGWLFVWRSRMDRQWFCFEHAIS